MTSDNLPSRRKPAATLLALALSASLATYGCTTNRVPGDGEPTRSPNVGGVPTSIPGSSGGTTVGRTDGSGFTAVRYDIPRPMLSSSVSRLTADQAAAMAQHQPARGTYLGPSNPGLTPDDGGVAAPTGQFTWPALQTNPQITVNSTISSPAVPAIVSGAGSDGSAAELFAAGVSGISAGGTAAAGTTTATTGTSAGIAIGTTNATAGTSGAIFSNNATALTPASAALPVTIGALAAGPGTGGSVVSPIGGANTGTLTPTVSSAGVITPTSSLNPAFGAQQSNARLGTPTTPTGTNPSTTVGTSSTTTAAGLRTVGRGAGSVRVINSNGRVTITNVNGSTANGENPRP